MGFRDDGATAWRRTGRPISTKTFDGRRTRIRRDDLAGHLTTLGAGRDASVVERRERWETVCTRGSGRALLRGPSTSPLGAGAFGCMKRLVIMVLSTQVGARSTY